MACIVELDRQQPGPTPTRRTAGTAVAVEDDAVARALDCAELANLRAPQSRAEAPFAQFTRPRGQRFGSLPSPTESVVELNQCEPLIELCLSEIELRR
jgi:hypothetical protein